MDRSSQPQLKLPADSSPIVDPHLSPDGTMLAYVKNHELNALDLLYNRSKRLTSGANGTTKVSYAHCSINTFRLLVCFCFNNAFEILMNVRLAVDVVMVMSDNLV